MMPSMMNAVTGMSTHAEGMGTISNDVANVNSVAHKQSELTFQELMDGLGVGLSAVITDFSNGNLMMTEISSNLGISGNGWFMVASPTAAAGEWKYTRAGDFTMEYEPATTNTYLVTPWGDRLRGVMGANPDATGLAPADLVDIVLPADTSSFTIDVDGTVWASIADAEPAIIGRVALVTFENNHALVSLPNGLYTATVDAGVQTMANPGSAGVGYVYQGYIESSNVDLAREFTQMILIQRGFQANSRSITTSDEMLQEVLALKR